MTIEVCLIYCKKLNAATGYSLHHTCLVNSGIAIAWRAKMVNRDNLALSLTDGAKELVEDAYGGFQVTLRKVQENLASTLHVRDLGLNETDLT